MTSQFEFPRVKRRLMCLLSALLLLALPLSAQKPAFAETAQLVPAVDPVSRRDSFTAVLYNNTNGLPTSEANDIAQTGEGFIWIGSYSGLIRYDGKTFERMDSTGGLAWAARICWSCWTAAGSVP